MTILRSVSAHFDFNRLSFANAANYEVILVLVVVTFKSMCHCQRDGFGLLIIVGTLIAAFKIIGKVEAFNQVVKHIGIYRTKINTTEELLVYGSSLNLD